MCAPGHMHTDVLERQLRALSSPAGLCAAGPAHPDSSGKSAWLQTSSGCSPAAHLASSDLHNVLHGAGSKAKTHPWFLLVSDLAGHPWDRDTDRQTHDGEFFPCGSSCVLLQAASHSNFATTSLDIFLESLFRLVQILLADSPQDCYQDKKKVFRENGRNSEQPV